MGRLLLVLGLIIAGIGLAMVLGLPLGRLPGDIVIRRGAFTLYVPITTCIIVSLVLTVILSLFRR